MLAVGHALFVLAGWRCSSCAFPVHVLRVYTARPELLFLLHVRFVELDSWMTALNVSVTGAVGELLTYHSRREAFSRRAFVVATMRPTSYTLSDSG